MSIPQQPHLEIFQYLCKQTSQKKKKVLENIRRRRQMENILSVAKISSFRYCIPKIDDLIKLLQLRKFCQIHICISYLIGSRKTFPFKF